MDYSSTYSMDPLYKQPKDSKMKWLYIGLGVLVVIIIVAILFFILRKGNKNPCPGILEHIETKTKDDGSKQLVCKIPDNIYNETAGIFFSSGSGDITGLAKNKKGTCFSDEQAVQHWKNLNPYTPDNYYSKGSRGEYSQVYPGSQGQYYSSNCEKSNNDSSIANCYNVHFPVVLSKDMKGLQATNTSRTGQCNSNADLGDKVLLNVIDESIL